MTDPIDLEEERKQRRAEAEEERKRRELYAKRQELLLSEWLKRELPDPDYLLGSVISTTSRWMIYGDTGLGKTLFAMAMAGAIASGQPFLNWGARQPRRVLYLDGEMPAQVFQASATTCSSGASTAISCRSATCRRSTPARARIGSGIR
jgi:hypothetical protein